MSFAKGVSVYAQEMRVFHTIYPASDSDCRFYPVSGAVYYGVFSSAGYIDGVYGRELFYRRIVSAAHPCLHGIPDHRTVGAFFLRVSLLFWNAAGTYLLSFQTCYSREGTDLGTV